MVGRLADSVEEAIRGCSAHVDFEESIEQLSGRIRASSRLSPEIYCIYFDLLQAISRDDLDESLRLLREMDIRIEAPLLSLYSRWGALPASTAHRYLTYVNVDPETNVNFKALDSRDFDEVRRCADSAFGLLKHSAPEIAAEIQSLVTEIVFVSGAPNEPLQFSGATSFFCWGALFLNADKHRDLVAMIDGLTHESAHAYLFSLSLGASFVDNPDDELHPSPLRVDPRPLDGIESGMLSKSEECEARDALAASYTAFWDGLKTVEDHASLTPLGRQVMGAARSYMVGQPNVAIDL